VKLSTLLVVFFAKTMLFWVDSLIYTFLAGSTRLEINPPKLTKPCEIILPPNTNPLPIYFDALTNIDFYVLTGY
jgi:hypothetical protein